MARIRQSAAYAAARAGEAAGAVENAANWAACLCEAAAEILADFQDHGLSVELEAIGGLDIPGPVQFRLRVPHDPDPTDPEATQDA